MNREMIYAALTILLLIISSQANKDVVEPLPASPSVGEVENPHPANSESECCNSNELKQLVQEQQEMRGLLAETVKILTLMTQVDKEKSSVKAEMLKVLRAIKETNDMQLTHMGNMARQHSLLVENHQALLFQVSRIGTKVQECSKQTTTKTIIGDEESDIELECLPRPTATNFTLRMANKSAVPPDLHFKLGKQGIVIKNPKPDHSGQYVCSELVNTEWRDSSVFHINIRKKMRNVPVVSVEVDECVRVIGEKLQLTCNTSNPFEPIRIKWKHSNNQTLHDDLAVKRSPGMVKLMSVVVLPHVNKSDAGNLTCITKNAAGENMSTILIRIAEKPFVTLTPLKPKELKPVVRLTEGATLELRVEVDAYPTIQDGKWSTPQDTNTSTYTETLTTIHRSYRQVASLVINKIRADESGFYNFTARGTNINATAHFKVYIYQKPSVVIDWRNGSLTCLASGNPAPSVSWKQCEKLHSKSDECASVHLLWEQHTLPQHDEFQPHIVQSVLLTHLNNATAECIAVNSVGVARQVFSVPSLLYITQPKPDLWTSQIFLTIVTASATTVMLLLILLGVCVYRCKQPPKYEIQWKIIEVSDGNNYTYIDPTQLPYNTKWEFPRDRLTFGQVLGSGAFGKVVEASAFGLEKDDCITQVAVKMLKPRALSEEKEALMCELKILSHLGSHANIVNLLGACTHGGPVLLITEFCSQGDLLNFLRRKAPVFINSVFHTHEFSHIYKNLTENLHHERHNEMNSYMDMQSGQRSPDSIQDQISGGQREKSPSALNTEHLLRFSAHVAEGMDFLASKNCIHRDVAARNVLVSDSLVAKICDFGLARDIMNDSNYVVRGNARLPVKWMSPESIFECLYTVQSDVWSYGILLWEIFSLGKSPYPDVVVDSRFYKMIRCGYHMSQPDFAPAEMYTIMKMCWSLDPIFRPTFKEIVQMIRMLKPENSEPEQHYTNDLQECAQTFDSMKFVKAQANENHDKTPEEQCLLTHSNNYQLY